MTSEVSKREPFDAARPGGGEEVTFELGGEDRLRVIVADEVELTIQWDDQSRAEVSREDGQVTFYT